ncbi:MAG: J domain-containing protein [Leptolyngbyaceae cyanobacterium MAG.088]|nr:J domain-containing protein [Leptolyngbyaceae cyanobacterium MAG.088]
MVNFDPYRVLDVKPTASQNEVKQAYRRLVKQFHPDSHPEVLNHDHIAQINAAYEVLGDPSQRQGYDQTRSQQTNSSQPQHWTTHAQRPSQVSRDIDSHLQCWLKQVYTPINRQLAQIISQLKPEIAQLAADPFDDELMEDFQEYLERCRISLAAAQISFQSMPNPANMASIAAQLYYCLTHLEDGVEELERFTLCYDDHYLNTGRELFRISAKLRSEAQEAVRVVL